MSKYGQFSRPQQQPRPWEVHPVWRGIGCLLILLIPIMSYAGAVLLVQENLSQGWLPMPAEFSRTVTLPLVGSVANFYAVLMVTVILIMAGFVILTVLYALVYTQLGPPRYGPLDSPPEHGRPRRRR
jgi:hypothetical protein